MGERTALRREAMCPSCKRSVRVYQGKFIGHGPGKRGALLCDMSHGLPADEPAVDTEAAEVWRGLSDAQRRAMKRPGYWLGDHSYGRTLRVLERRGLIRALSWVFARQDWSAIVTDLGKRVAAYGRTQTDGAK